MIWRGTGTIFVVTLGDIDQGQRLDLSARDVECLSRPPPWGLAR